LSGPDLLACETIPSLQEAQAILVCLKNSPKVKGWFSFSCRDERHVSHGEEIRACARMLNGEAQVVATGVNCTPPRFIRPLIAELRTETQKAIVVYPNAGRAWDAVSRGWLGAGEIELFSELGKSWRAAGATWIGGCCGTTPTDIANLCQALQAA
jgi:homocysteine S-methyltransferase